MTHVSIRLPWHDRGWDGHVCDHPERNGYCGGPRSVNAERIRARDVDLEFSKRGVLVGEDDYRPPCTETLNVFGQSSIEHTHVPPTFITNARPIKEVYEAGSSGTWPFERMWLANGEFRPAAERKREADQHFQSLSADRSFAFYYCNYDNPISGDNNQYLLVGIARLKKVESESLSWPGASADAAERYGGFVWSRRVTNAGAEERLRLPYQEMLRAGMVAEDIARTAVFVPGDIANRFKYVSRHLDDDDAAILLEQAINFIRVNLQQDLLPGGAASWHRSLAWLDTALSDCWSSRGPFPGLTAVLSFLDFKEPAEFVRTELKDVAAEKWRDWIFDRIEELEDAPSMLRHRFAPAIDRWKSLREDLKKLLKERMVLFAIGEEQLNRAIGAKRKSWGVDASWNSICENPYILSEDYLGEDQNDRISFSRIDHGLRPRPPHDQAVDLERVARIDGRRLRALIVANLKEAASGGHTFLDQAALAEAIKDPDGDPSDIRGALIDEARWRQHSELFSEKVIIEHVDGVNSVFLKPIRDDEARIRTDVVNLIRAGVVDSPGTDWRAIISENSSDVIEDALGPQSAALETLHRASFSVLTGGAGTGKTTVLRAFVAGLRRQEPNHPVLLLAPTGKASVLLSDRVGIAAETIHRFLSRMNWLRPSNFSLLREGGDRESRARTVIIDESSMIDVTLLAAVFRALNFDYVDRLILVGDPGQLPPIGPGRPFLDIIEYLRKTEERRKRHLAELTFNCRQAQGSNIAILADHFARVEERPDEGVFDLLQRGGERGDLAVRTYASEADLPATIRQVYEEELQRLYVESTGGRSNMPLAGTYREVFGLNAGGSVNLDRLQVLAPYRLDVDQINETIRRSIWKFGSEKSRNGLFAYDRVMQTENKTLRAYDTEKGENTSVFIPNGQIGFASEVSQADFDRSKKIPVRFAPQYWRFKFDMSETVAQDNLAFAYGLSIHKSQGSQFNTVIAVVPTKDSDFLSRELVYTLVTRAQNRLVLLLEKDAGAIRSRTWGGHSELLRRNSALFRTARGWGRSAVSKFRTDELIHQALPELFVRSRGEAVIAQTLSRLGISFYYERSLHSKDGGIGKAPDFTFRMNRRDWYLEHLGMLGTPKYDKDWARKKQWYTQNGYDTQLLTTPIEGKSILDSLREIFCGHFSFSEDAFNRAAVESEA